VAVPLLVFGWTLAWATDEGSSVPIRLGMSSPLSGSAGAYGQQMREGVEAGFAEANMAGGVHGHRLELISLDDGYDASTAASNALRLVKQDNVLALMAFYGSATTTAVLPILEQYDVPLIGTVTGSDALRQPFNPHLFHLRASYADETTRIVKHLMTLGMQRLAVFYQDDAFGVSGLKGVMQALDARHLKLVASAAVPRNSSDVGAAVAVIAKSDPQAVVMISLYRPTAAFVRQMRDAGSSASFVALSPVGTDQLIADLGYANSRALQVSQVIPYPWGDKLEVVRDYKKALASFSRSVPVSYYGLEGYLNARLVVAALRRAGRNPTRERLVAALREGPFDLGGFRVTFAPGSNSGSSYCEISVIGADGRILN
jgi:ABC-type branched-subunit amino acid transport system substrate-binding protein